MVGALAGTLPACATETAPDAEELHGELVSNQFFENATRRDSNAIEASRVARVANVGCSAFFLENTSRKVFVATARHCFDFQIDKWCAEGGGIIDNAGQRGGCTRVIAADPQHDIAVFESDIQHAAAGDSTLRLASYVPKTGSKLVMTGYPIDADPENPRRGKLTTTENCWTLTGSVESPFVGLDNDATIDRSARHNCSTFGGNSGGPMYLEGTRDAVGIPFMYQDDYTRRSATKIETSSYLALMSDFVAKHHVELASAGIVVAEGDGEADDERDDEKKDSESADGKTKRPAPVREAQAQSCSMGASTAGGRGFAGLVGLGLVAVAARRRRRA